MRFMLNRPIGADDAPYLEQHREVFLDRGLTLRALYRSVVDDARYQEADSDAAGASPLRSMRPDQVAGTVQALTGFRWTWENNDMLDTDDDGLRILAGGVDGIIATSPAPDPSTTTALVFERLAEAAGQFAVENEGSLAAEDRTLFREIDLDAEALEAERIAQIQALLLRCHGKRYAADDADVTSLSALWSTLYDATGSSRDAWALLLSGVLRHPDFLAY